ncbi:hypothetical protein KUTeg_000499 [Tegillarca granosa]|uniref:Uncharacterized protein n=1 Tax=Tegillarca granosa TaxID=220873 RepID=A0ABQ9FXQ4_TEGGR|nr:hypothetical protein KUTeg_000499 [Tegillarca granosa]
MVTALSGNNFYIHGGISKKDSTEPSDKLYKLELSSLTWSEINEPNSPALSHHACVPLENRYMVLIGGWNGKARTSKIFVYDTQKNVWLFPKSSGFPEDAGLSSHTASLLSKGEIIILGREGSLRMQRRSGSVYILKGSVESGFTYSHHGAAMDSRSGHTTNFIGSTLIVVGGRNDKLLEIHGGYKSGLSQPVTVTSKFADVAQKLKPVSKMPGGRKNHIAIEGPGAILIHGGETFDGRSKEPVGEMYILTQKPTISMVKVGISTVGRAAHVYCITPDKILIHGGLGGNCLYIHGGLEKIGSLVPSNKLYKLDFDTLIWNEVRVSGGPALSHHTCIPLKDRYMVLIGGWNGKSRTSDVFAFDTETKTWLFPKVSGFPDDGGLSSHTASLLNTGEILVLGREGSLRMQRLKEAGGNAYMLKGSVEKGEFRYSEYSGSTDSRSGHTTNFIDSTLYIIGGRNDNLLEAHSGYKTGLPKNLPEMKKFKDMAKKLQPLLRIPGGRKNHIVVEGSGFLFIHGGLTFDGRIKEPVGDMFLMTNKPNINFYKIGVSRVGRAGHICCVTSDHILFHGGFGGKTTVYGDTRYLEFR